MLDKIRLLLGNSASDAVIETLILQAQSFLLLFCNLSEYNNKYDSLIIRMVIEDYNRMGSEGLTSKSYNGISESYSSEPYSPLVMTQLRSFTKVKLV